MLEEVPAKLNSTRLAAAGVAEAAMKAAGELSTLRQMMKVPNEPGLNPNNGLENAFLSDQSMASNPRKGQAKRFGAKLSAHGKKPGSDAVPYDFLS
ncbi:TPA: hypothetical protein ACH3X3_013805 [Trebouxia sp. C0006]